MNRARWAPVQSTTNAIVGLHLVVRNVEHYADTSRGCDNRWCPPTCPQCGVEAKASAVGSRRIVGGHPRVRNGGIVGVHAPVCDRELDGVSPLVRNGEIVGPHPFVRNAETYRMNRSR